MLCVSVINARSEDLKQELPEKLNALLDMPAKPSGGITRDLRERDMKLDDV